MSRTITPAPAWPFCGKPMSEGTARSCRECWRKGLGARRGAPTGPDSIVEMLNIAQDSNVESVTDARAGLSLVRVGPEERIIQEAGGEYLGIEEGLVWFNEPETRTTMTVSRRALRQWINQGGAVALGFIKQLMDAKRSEFAAAKAAMAGGCGPSAARPYAPVGPSGVRPRGGFEI